MNKKAAVLLAAGLLAVSLVSCGRTENARAVDRMIAELGPIERIGPEDAGEIGRAQEALDALTAEEKESLHQAERLAEITEELQKKLDEKEIAEIIEEIESLPAGEIPAARGQQIGNLMQRYNRRSEEIRSRVTNADRLIKAAEQYEALYCVPLDEEIAAFTYVPGKNTPYEPIHEAFAFKKLQSKCAKLHEYFYEKLKNAPALEERIADADKRSLEKAEKLLQALEPVTLDSLPDIEYAEGYIDALPQELEKAVPDADRLMKAKQAYSALQVKAVMEQIENIGTVTLESGGRIEAANEAYKALKIAQRTQVENRKELESALKEYQKLRREEGFKKLKSYRVYNDEVRDMQFYYHKSMPRYVNDRSYVLPYIGRKGDRVWLCLDYHYTGGSWVFFNEVTIRADEEKFSNSFDYFDVTRDNGGGEVWEYYDTGNVSDYEVKMLRAMSTAEKAIIRFEGDDYYRDYTVSSRDKQIIRETLDLFDSLHTK